MRVQTPSKKIKGKVQDFLFLFVGFSDPYVLIQFCPEHIFHDVPVQKTSIKKKTLNPVFDESFEL